jgi:hypothetical protein
MCSTIKVGLESTLDVGVEECNFMDLADKLRFTTYLKE